MRRKPAPIFPNVKKIKGNSVKSEPDPKPIRCAAYCRVSHFQDDPNESSETQIRYYTNLINATPGCVLAGIYSDNGKSGLKQNDRPAFQRLMNHCREGRIDKVLTKSVSRISRNANDFLQTIRTLKDLGISIVFEREGFDTLSTDNDFLLSTFAAIAQEESRSTSENLRWAFQKRFSNGMPRIRRALGYDVIKHGTSLEVKVIEDEARIVREIFDLALLGHSQSDIARRMMAKGYKTASGSAEWGCHTVKCILRNITYTGSPINNKIFRKHYLDQYARPNKGERPVYRYEQHHEAIISQESFDQAQLYLQKYKGKSTNTWVRYPLSGRLICGDCGAKFHRRKSKEKYVYWFCARHRKAPVLCEMGLVRDKDIETTMRAAFMARYKFDKQLVLKKLKSDLERINDTSTFEHARLAMQDELIVSTKHQQESTGKKHEIASAGRSRVEADLRGLEMYWSQIEADRSIRLQAITWLNELPQSENRIDRLIHELDISHMRAWILNVRVWSSGHYSFLWFDNVITNIHTGQKRIHIDKPQYHVRDVTPIKERTVIPKSKPSTIVRVKPQRILHTKLTPVLGSSFIQNSMSRKRVAAYVRVSSDNIGQQSSYELQIAHYTQYIRSMPEWHFAGIYADEASGTSLKNRPNFLRMIEDAKDGKIDLILSKSISRVSRSVCDFLHFVRLLKGLNPPVGIYLEKENLNTLDSQSELILTLMSALAQEESLANSENSRWGIEKRFSFGIVPLTKLCYGYQLDDQAQWTINESEAKIVRTIFHDCLAGKSTIAIAKELNQTGISNITANGAWRASNVSRILHNETYTGDLLLNKQFTRDYLSHKQCINRGERPKFLIESHHPPIVTKGDYEKSQAIMTARDYKKSKGDYKAHNPEKRKRFYRVFTCSRCGDAFIHIRTNNGRYRLMCHSSIYHGQQEICHISSIAVVNLEHAFSVMLMEMRLDKKRLQAETKMAIEKARITDEQVQRLAELNSHIESLLEELMQESLFVQNTEDADDHLARINSLTIETEKSQTELNQLKTLESTSACMEADLAWLIGELDSVKEFDPNQEMVEFREDIFNRLVKRGEVLEDFMIRLELSIGIEWNIQCMGRSKWVSFTQRMKNNQK